MNEKKVRIRDYFLLLASWIERLVTAAEQVAASQWEENERRRAQLLLSAAAQANKAETEALRLKGQTFGSGGNYL